MIKTATLLALALVPCLAGPASDADAAPSTAGVKHALEAIMPAGVRISDVKLTGQRVVVNGSSRSNQQVSQFMRVIDQAKGFHGSQLESIASAGTEMRFTMTMDVQCPKPGERVASNPCDAAASAATTVFKCNINGVTTYQSTPCAAASKR